MRGEHAIKVARPVAIVNAQDVETPDALAKAPPKQGGHRALDDIRESVAELRYYRGAVFR